MSSISCLAASFDLLADSCRRKHLSRKDYSQRDWGGVPQARSVTVTPPSPPHRGVNITRYCVWLGQKETSHWYNSVLSVGQFEGSVSYNQIRKKTQENALIYIERYCLSCCQSTKSDSGSVTQDCRYCEYAQRTPMVI